MTLQYRLDIPPSGPVTLSLRDGAERMSLLSVPQFYLTPFYKGDWRACALSELRSQIISLECAVRALSGEIDSVPVVISDRRPVHTCALPPAIADAEAA